MGLKRRKPHPALFWSEAMLVIDDKQLYRDFGDFDIRHHRGRGTFLRVDTPRKLYKDSKIFLMEDGSFVASEQKIEIPWTGNWNFLYIPEHHEPLS